VLKVLMDLHVLSTPEPEMLHLECRLFICICTLRASVATEELDRVYSYETYNIRSL
jgi:hypothetical protein